VVEVRIHRVGRDDHDLEHDWRGVVETSRVVVMTRRETSSLAGQLGRIPLPPKTDKPRPPKFERPHRVAPAKPGAAKPKPAKPNKPARRVVPKRDTALRSAGPKPHAQHRSVAGRLGALKGRGRGR
jgi:hypothetical protein